MKFGQRVTGNSQFRPLAGAWDKSDLNLRFKDILRLVYHGEIALRLRGYPRPEMTSPFNT